jgi:cytochrome c2
MTASSRISPARSILTALCAGVAVTTAAASAGPMEHEVPDAFEVCLACHAFEPDEAPLEGPTLWGVVGRQIASVEGFDYSDALRRHSGNWDRATLDRFLSNPQAFAPGTRMDMGGLRNETERAAVLDFLEQLKPDGAPAHPDDD